MHKTYFDAGIAWQASVLCALVPGEGRDLMRLLHGDDSEVTTSQLKKPF